MSEHQGEKQRGEKRDRKRKWENARQNFGSRGKSKDLGRGAWSRQRQDKRTLIGETTAKRQKREEDGEELSSVLPKPFSQEEIEAEERKPKHKVAVMIGYAGNGYRGMQINTTERTIEGDLFTAFVGAGAISKANANDPKKSGLVRCARTDKGVSAAGNVISLKLILEDPDIVEKINNELSPQIRVWGIQRTVGSFSCYQACDSRWYEYLIPSYAFLPPHPSSVLGKALVELAEEAGDLEGYQKRQDEVKDFWTETEAKYISLILEELDETTKGLVLKALYESELEIKASEDDDGFKDSPESPANNEERPKVEVEEAPNEPTIDATAQRAEANDNLKENVTTETPKLDRRTLEAIAKRLRAAYVRAKRAYRISPARMARIQPTLDCFVGTQSFHNYTIQKNSDDPSAQRHIKSFRLDPEPKLIRGDAIPTTSSDPASTATANADAETETEWLSLKIHGQSFMMHQIRKMVSAAVLVIRCGGDARARLGDTLSKHAAVSIPKAPALGLLLERPVFDSYNAGAAVRFQREPLDFAKHDAAIEAFKRREIYGRIFGDEVATAAFHAFFAQIDGFTERAFWWASSMGLAAAGARTMPAAKAGKSGGGQGSGEKGGTRGRADGDAEDGGAGAGTRKRKRAARVDSDDESDAEEGRRRHDTDG